MLEIKISVSYNAYGTMMIKRVQTIINDVIVQMEEKHTISSLVLNWLLEIR